MQTMRMVLILPLSDLRRLNYRLWRKGKAVNRVGRACVPFLKAICPRGF